MDRRTKQKLAAGSAAAFLFAVALGAGGALAAVGLFAEDDDEATAVLATAEADDDGADAEDALERTLEFLVDEAVEAGRLTEEEGEELKAELQRGVTPFAFPRLDRGLFGDRGFDFGRLRGLPFVRPQIDLDAAASYLGLSQEELRDELAEGRSLAEIARAEGKSVEGLVQELVDVAEERIDEAVEDGRLSEERAAELKDGLEERIEERVNEELRGFGLRLGDFWHDLERFRGPGG
jgi:polyhydroxyalkanoate synthesis regulator phasin